ncbi:lupus La protein homolog [Parasteatoda tepidariorum]|uniref:lupus La protein homolog n=1 Tax=Parasteatoda tepidariorum TaxID=114398 RepID=UPI00077FD00B|nr:lupus La protein homolog [Parasteatoda tepidariorum]
MGTEVIPVPENQEKPSELEQKVIRQIEYYFGNYNLGRDKFLKEELKKDDGWVPLETMVRFQRLKQMNVDFETISAALKKSPNQLMEVSDDCTKIRRRAPVPENVDRGEMDDRSLYVKGFKRETTLDQVLDFFKDYKVENVMMRKRRQGDKFFFKGSVFATFETQADCDSFFEKKGIKFDKTEMLKERKKDYVKRKDEFFENLRAEKAKKKEAGEKDKEDTPKGCLLKIIGITDESIKRDDVRKAMEEYGNVAFVDFFAGNTDAVIRFKEGIVSELLSKLEEEDGVKKLQIGSVKATLSLIDGEEETKYWEKIKSFSKQKGNQKNFNKGRFGKKNRNRNQRGTKRNDNAGAENEDEPPSKKIKTEEDKPDTSVKVESAPKDIKSETME